MLCGGTAAATAIQSVPHYNDLHDIVAVWYTAHVSSSEPLIRIASVTQRLPEPPGEELWPYLDAAARCIVRFGGRRTTARDIAAEAGVDRTTIYRRVGPLAQIYRLLLARELHRLIGEVTARMPLDLDGPGTVTEVVALGIELSAQHPVMAKILADEPDMVAEHVLSNIDGIIAVHTAALAPLLALTTSPDAGLDPYAVAEWLARFAMTALLSPPHGDLRSLIDAVVRPLLRSKPD